LNATTTHQLAGRVPTQVAGTAIETIPDRWLISAEAEFNRIEPVCVFFSASIVNCKVATGPHELVNEVGPGYELTIGVQIKDRLSVYREQMANEICLRITQIFSASMAD
jgi:hypothetical protein